jgi:molecular chaperone GrpE
LHPAQRRAERASSRDRLSSNEKMNSEQKGSDPIGSTDADPGAAPNVTSDQADGAGPPSEGVAAAPGAAGELEALRDRYLRLAAEFENYRKRTERERGEARDRAQAQLVEKLLEPLDDLQRVAKFSAEGTTVDALLEGVRMVERKLVRMLESAGLETVDAKGERFDPALHDALMMVPTPERSEDDTVGEVLQPGYVFRGSLVRPARVQVRKYGG